MSRLSNPLENVKKTGISENSTMLPYIPVFCICVILGVIVQGLLPARLKCEVIHLNIGLWIIYF